MRGLRCPTAKHHLAEGGAQHPDRRVSLRLVPEGGPYGPGVLLPAGRSRKPLPPLYFLPPASFYHPEPESLPERSVARLGDRGGTAWLGSGSTSALTLSLPHSVTTVSHVQPEQTERPKLLSCPPWGSVAPPTGPSPSPPPNPGASTQVLPSGQLQIVRASPEDAGNYFCIAQNNVGSAVGKTRLVVQGGSMEGAGRTW